MNKPLLVAMNNPISSDPKFALYPHPRGCAGWRLHKMLSEYSLSTGGERVSVSEYIRSFDRRNVLSAREWSAREAREGAARLLDTLVVAPYRVVVLGVATLDALGLPRPQWGEWVGHTTLFGGNLDYTVLPHPSGRCREYNDPKMCDLAGETLLTELERYRRSCGLVAGRV